MNDDKKYIELEGVDTLVSDIRDKVYGVLAQKADITDIPQDISAFNNDVGYLAQTDLTRYEQNTNKVTSMSSSSTNIQYPSAKAVYDSLELKQDTLTAGTNITIDANNVISSAGTTYTAGANITIDANNEISATDTTYSAFTGTDGNTGGTAGLVPAPSTADVNKFLNADGSWRAVSSGTTDYTNLTNKPKINGTTLSGNKYSSDFGLLETADIATSVGPASTNNSVAGAKAAYDASLDVYSETERRVGTWIDGKPLYRKTVNFGNLPNNSSNVTAHGISNVDVFTKIEGIGIRLASGGLSFSCLPLPYPASNFIELYAKAANIEISTNSDRSAYNGYITLEYTKTTDPAPQQAITIQLGTMLEINFDAISNDLTSAISQTGLSVEEFLDCGVNTQLILGTGTGATLAISISNTGDSWVVLDNGSRNLLGQFSVGCFTFPAPGSETVQDVLDVIDAANMESCGNPVLITASSYQGSPVQITSYNTLKVVLYDGTTIDVASTAPYLSEVV